MRTPRYTDLDRYRVPYRPSNKTDIAATFRRIRAEQAKAKDAPVPIELKKRRAA